MDKRHFINKEKFDIHNRRIKKITFNLSSENGTFQIGNGGETYGFGTWELAKDENEARWKPNSNAQTIFYVRLQIYDINSATAVGNSFMHGINLYKKKETDADNASFSQVQEQIYNPTPPLDADQSFFMAEYRRNEGEKSSSGMFFEPIYTIFNDLAPRGGGGLNVKSRVIEIKRSFTQHIKNWTNIGDISPGQSLTFLDNMYGETLFVTHAPHLQGGTLWCRCIAEVWYYESGNIKLFTHSNTPQYN